MRPDSPALHAEQLVLVSWGALIGLLSVSLVLLYGQSRMLYAMSRDGMLFRCLSLSTTTKNVPRRLLVTIGGLCAIVAGFAPPLVVEETVNIGTLFAFVLVSAATVRLRNRRPDLPRTYRAPALPFVASLAIVACLALMLSLKVVTWLIFAGWLLCGLLIYFIINLFGQPLGRLFGRRGKRRPHGGG